MDTNKTIASRRNELGLSDRYVAEAIGTNLDSYCDIEWHRDELARTVPILQIKKLSKILGLEIFGLLSLQCPFCSGETPYSDAYRLPRNELIRTSRLKAGLSHKELGDHSAFQDYAIEGMERDPEYLERSTVASIMDLVTALGTLFKSCPV